MVVVVGFGVLGGGGGCGRVVVVVARVVVVVESDEDSGLDRVELVALDELAELDSLGVLESTCNVVSASANRLPGAPPMCSRVLRLGSPESIGPVAKPTPKRVATQAPTNAPMANRRWMALWSGIVPPYRVDPAVDPTMCPPSRGVNQASSSRAVPEYTTPIEPKTVPCVRTRDTQ